MNPDVISFNEINHYGSPTADYIKIMAAKLKARTGQTWSYNWIQKSGAATTNRSEFLQEATSLAPKGVVSLLVDAMWSAPEWYAGPGSC